MLPLLIMILHRVGCQPTHYLRGAAEGLPLQAGDR